MFRFHPRAVFAVSCAVGAIFMTGCGGGGSSDPVQVPDRDACNVIGLQSRIISGTRCAGRSAVLKLRIDDGRDVFGCTGTLVAPDKVLTATHCVTDETFTRPVRAAGITVSHGRDSEVIARASRVINNPQAAADLRAIADEAERRGDDPSSPNFDLTSYIRELGLADAAVVVLDRRLSLPTVPIRTSAVPADGTILSIFGYGATDPNIIVASDSLFSGEMAVDSTGPKNIFSRFGDSGSDTCNGDSGGPALAQEADGTYSIVATTLGGSERCTPGDVAIFTSAGGTGLPEFLRSAAPDASFR